MPRTIDSSRKPRSVRPNEQPRATRGKCVQAARLSLLKNYEQVLQRVEALRPVVEEHNRQVDARFTQRMHEAAKKAEQAGKPFTWEARQKLEVEREQRHRAAYAEVYYQELLQQRLALADDEPDIDQVTQPEIRPGWVVKLLGSCFGPPQGKVLLEIAADQVIELDVYSWSETRVQASVNPIIAQIPLRPHYGRIWLKTGAGATSNVWPIMYRPTYSLYFARWTKHLFGYLWGNSHSETFLEGKTLGDPDFYVDRVELSHCGDGHSELRWPNASGQDMAQGWHMGVAAGGDAWFYLSYHVIGPKNIWPPEFDELGGPFAYCWDVA